MAQSQVNIQTQQQVQVQRLTPLQMQVVKMLEMPVDQLDQRVRDELDSNSSLESTGDGLDDNLYADQPSEASSSDINEYDDESERRSDALEEALDSIGRDDRDDDHPSSDDLLPRYNSDDNGRTIENANVISFIDTLLEQMHEQDLTEEQQEIMEYLINSLDDSGLLTKDLTAIADELMVYHSIYTSNDELMQMVKILQTFEPAGIGAQSLKECLLIQAENLRTSPVRMLVYQVIDECFDDFMNNRWERIMRSLHITEAQADDIRREIKKRLNPKPGASLGEAQGRSLNQITPDFIVYVDDSENISFILNNGRIPSLHLVKEDEELLNTLSANKDSLSRRDKEGMTFLQNNVARANMFIDAIRQRNETMTKTMRAIITLQRKFFLTGDEADLNPMALRNIAERTGQDKSTVSRVCNSKYVETQWGIFPLKFFFSGAYTPATTGETMSTKAIKNTLRELIENEDKRHPLSDEALAKLMSTKDAPIARRTVAKYRDAMNIPTSRLRKK